MNLVIGTTAEWAAASGRILTRGQLGYDETADVLKVGDGASAWAALPAVGAGGGAAWGTMTGVISAQADLMAALAAKLAKAGGTMTGPLVTAAPATDAGLNLTPAATDPSSPVDGDIWRRTADLRARVGGTNYSVAFLNGAQTFTGAKTFNAPVDFAQQPSVNFVIENRTSDPASPVTGQMWLRTDL